MLSPINTLQKHFIAQLKTISLGKNFRRHCETTKIPLSTILSLDKISLWSSTPIAD